MVDQVRLFPCLYITQIVLQRLCTRGQFVLVCNSPHKVVPTGEVVKTHVFEYVGTIGIVVKEPVILKDLCTITCQVLQLLRMLHAAPALTVRSHIHVLDGVTLEEQRCSNFQARSQPPHTPHFSLGQHLCPKVKCSFERALRHCLNIIGNVLKVTLLAFRNVASCVTGYSVGLVSNVGDVNVCLPSKEQCRVVVIDSPLFRPPCQLVQSRATTS